MKNSRRSPFKKSKTKSFKSFKFSRIKNKGTLLLLLLTSSINLLNGQSITPANELGQEIVQKELTVKNRCDIRLNYYDLDIEKLYTEAEFKKQIFDSEKILDNPVFERWSKPENKLLPDRFYNLSSITEEIVQIEAEGGLDSKSEQKVLDRRRRRKKRQVLDLSAGGSGNSVSVPVPTEISNDFSIYGEITDPSEFGAISDEILNSGFIEATTRQNPVILDSGSPMSAASPVSPIGASGTAESPENGEEEEKSDAELVKNLQEIDPNKLTAQQKKTLRRQNYLQRKEYDTLSEMYRKSQKRLNNLEKQINYDCANLNTRVLPDDIPRNAYSLKLSYNNIDVFCGLDVPASAITEYHANLEKKLNGTVIGDNAGSILDFIDSVEDNDGVIDIGPTTAAGLGEDQFLEQTTGADYQDYNEVTPTELISDSTIGPSIPYYQNIKEFDLSYNPLHEICDYSFTSFPNVEKIIISNTHLKKMTDLTLYSVKNVRIFELNFNGISFFGPGTFANMVELRELTATTNYISKLPENLFANCSRLEKVNINQNLIESIDVTSFAGCSGLVQIDLYKNKISKLEDFTFQDLVQLQWLSLTNNRLSEITANTFKGLINLIQLDLDNNNIEVINKEAFQDMTQIEKIQLNNNKIKIIEPRWFEAGVLSSEISARVLLGNNAFSCGCEATKFKLWLESTGKTVNLKTPEKNNKDYFFRVTEINPNTVGLPCAHPSHLRSANFKLNTMDLSWFPSSVAETKNCRAPRKPREFIFNRYFYEKHSMELTCQNIDAYPSPHTFWVNKDNSTKESTDGKFTITNAKQEQTGIYICEIMNIVGKVDVKYNVNIYHVLSIVDCEGNIIGSSFETDHIDKYREECEEKWEEIDAKAEEISEDYVYGLNSEDGFSDWEGDYDYGDGASDVRVSYFSLLALFCLTWFFQQ